MTGLIDDLKLAWREMQSSSGAAMTVLQVLVLGVALNVVALNAMDGVRAQLHPDCDVRHTSGIARSEVKAIRTVVALALKRIGDGRRGWCTAQQWVSDRRRDVAEYRADVEFGPGVCVCVLDRVA